ncbi:MAG: cupin domain-containing protein [Bacteroidota bacterium]
MFFPKTAQPVETVAPGVSRQVLARGGGLMTVEVRFAKGVAMPPHTHPHEQVSYILAGRFEGFIGGEKTILTAGDTYYVPPDVPHTVTALEDSVILDVFTPQREDFLR